MHARVHTLSQPHQPAVKTMHHAHPTQVVLPGKRTPTFDAVVMALSVMLVQAMRAPEEPITSLTVVMLVEAMFIQLKW